MCALRAVRILSKDELFGCQAHAKWSGREQPHRGHPASPGTGLPLSWARCRKQCWLPGFRHPHRAGLPSQSLHVNSLCRQVSRLPVSLLYPASLHLISCCRCKEGRFTPNPSSAEEDTKLSQCRGTCPSSWGCGSRRAARGHSAPAPPPAPCCPLALPLAPGASSCPGTAVRPVRTCRPDPRLCSAEPQTALLGGSEGGR